MENFIYYQTLAEKIFFSGAERGEFSSFAKYRPGKSSKDLEHAIQIGGLDGLGETPSMAQRLYEVLEIDTKAFDKKYGKAQQRLSEPTN